MLVSPGTYRISKPTGLFLIGYVNETSWCIAILCQYKCGFPAGRGGHNIDYYYSWWRPQLAIGGTTGVDADNGSVPVPTWRSSPISGQRQWVKQRVLPTRAHQISGSPGGPSPVHRPKIWQEFSAGGISVTSGPAAGCLLLRNGSPMYLGKRDEALLPAHG